MEDLIQKVNELNEDELIALLEHLAFEIRGTLCQNGIKGESTKDVLDMVSSDLARASREDWTEDELESFRV